MDGRESQPIPENEPALSLKEQLVAAIETGDLASTIQVLKDLDKKLTGRIGSYLDPDNKGHPDFTREIELFLDKVRWKDLASLTIPLHGGYSRLLLATEDGKVTLELSRNTSPEVEQRWQEL